MNVSACLSVRPYRSISKTTCPKPYEIFCVARSSPDDNAICRVLPASWMTSCLPIIRHNGALLGRIFIVTHQGAASGRSMMSPIASLLVWLILWCSGAVNNGEKCKKKLMVLGKSIPQNTSGQLFGWKHWVNLLYRSQTTRKYQKDRYGGGPRGVIVAPVLYYVGNHNLCTFVISTLVIPYNHTYLAADHIFFVSADHLLQNRSLRSRAVKRLVFLIAH